MTLSVENVVTDTAGVPAGSGGRAGRHVLIGVSDTGEGIPPEIRERIFDAFFTTKGVGKGTGLGLSTVLDIVKSHGGFVTLESEVGRGSRFRVFLPATEEVEIEHTPAAGSGHFCGRQQLILVVDDEESVRLATRHVLETHQYRVLTAENGSEALSIFLKHRDCVRVVVTDLLMPVLDGVGLIRVLRSLEADLRIIATSGLEDPDRSSELVALGVTEFLLKPCGADQLLATLVRQRADAG